MKQLKFWMIAATLLCGLTATLTACSSDDDDKNSTPTTPTYTPTPLAKANYTLLYYAQGGGDLDVNILTNINQFYQGLSAIGANKVHVAIQYKASTRENIKKQFITLPNITAADADEAGRDMGSTTFRLVANSNYSGFQANIQALQEKCILGRTGSNADITKPDSLANFIKWAAKMAPADKYILIMSSHGGGYLPHDDYMQATTRGIIYDDGYQGHFFSLPDITEALEKSGVHMTAIYMDACLMNTLEYQFELQPLTDYLLLSSFSVPGFGGQYNSLVQQLGTNSSLETALSQYVKYTVNFWDEYGGSTPHHDMTITRTNKLDNFGAKLKEFTDKLIDAYQNGGDDVRIAIDAATKGAFKVEKLRPLYDIHDYYHAVAQAAPTYFSSSFIADLDNAFSDAIVYQQCSKYLTSQGYKIEASVLMGAQNHYTVYFWQNSAGFWDIPTNGILRYEGDGTLYTIDPTTGYVTNTERWQSDFDHSYKMTRFDKTTGWSRWIEINQQEPNSRSAADWGI